MSPRHKKPPVKPEDRQQWLQEFEAGQSPPKIAADYGFDARTVRKHLDAARSEKETKEARSSVLRNALERHYADLCRYAETLGRQSQSSRPLSTEADFGTGVPYEQQLRIALRQHIPRSPIWSLLSKHARLETEEADLIQALGRKIEKGVASDSRLLANLADEENGVVPGLVDALRAQVEQRARDWASLNVKDNLISGPAENGVVDLRYGAFSLGKVRQGHVAAVGKAISRWTATVKKWDELNELKKTVNALARARSELQDEIAVIALRRVVPGRCRYCPA